MVILLILAQRQLVGLDHRSYCMSGLVSTGIGDNLHAGCRLSITLSIQLCAQHDDDWA